MHTTGIQKTINKKLKLKKIFLCGLLLLTLFTLVSCESVDKDDASLTLTSVDYEYYEETNITMVSCKVDIQNDTIYNIKSFDVDLGVYCNGEPVENEPYHYNSRIKHGEKQSVSISFTAEGEVDHTGLVSWTPQFEPLWKTHLTLIVIVVILIVVGIVFWIKETVS